MQFLELSLLSGLRKKMKSLAEKSSISAPLNRKMHPRKKIDAARAFFFPVQLFRHLLEHIPLVHVTKSTRTIMFNNHSISLW